MLCSQRHLPFKMQIFFRSNKQKPVTLNSIWCGTGTVVKWADNFLDTILRYKLDTLDLTYFTILDQNIHQTLTWQWQCCYLLYCTSLLYMHIVSTYLFTFIFICVHWFIIKCKDIYKQQALSNIWTRRVEKKGLQESKNRRKKLLLFPFQRTQK